LVEEIQKGELQNSKRLWLVDCKHFAHANRTVGVNDITDIRDRCERVKAEGFLLACSTTISSELSRKLEELSVHTCIASEVWDAVTMEKLILTPHSYSIGQQFFPVSMGIPVWRMFYTECEERWMAHFKGFFLYVESRSGIEPPPLLDLEVIIHELERVGLGEGESLRIRGIWHDTPHGPYYCVGADYLVPSERLPALSPSDMNAQLDESCVNGGNVAWNIKLQITIPQSDYYSPDDPGYYSSYRQPLLHAFYGVGDLSSMVERNKWINQTPPLLRAVNDHLIWSKNKEKFGYTKVGDMECRVI